eukprot:g1581.t1
MRLRLLCILSLAPVVVTKDSWSCGADGYWIDPNGAKSSYPCGNDDKSGSSGGDKDSSNWGDKDGKADGAAKDDAKTLCSATDMSGAAAFANYPRTCINSAPNNSPRCWWTHVPDAVKAATSQVPLVVDMHGGGGCAYHQEAGSGFKSLSDSLGADSFVTVWPQGADSLWASCGSDCASAQGQAAAQEKGSTGLASWDDIGFLTQMISNIVRGEGASDWKGRVDPERVYVTGFSLGCMMAHRFALERSQLVAGLGCHGGELSLVDTTVASELAVLRSRFSVQPMPVYLTIGDQDVWFSLAKPDWRAWSTLNQCAANSTAAVTLTASSSSSSAGAKGAGKTSESTAALEHVSTGCASMGGGSSSASSSSSLQPSSPSSATVLETVLLEITGGAHTLDPRMAQRTWAFLSKYRRAGALARLPAAVTEVVPAASGGGGSGGGGGGGLSAGAVAGIVVAALAVAVVGVAAVRKMRGLAAAGRRPGAGVGVGASSAVSNFSPGSSGGVGSSSRAAEPVVASLAVQESLRRDV